MSHTLKFTTCFVALLSAFLLSCEKEEKKDIGEGSAFLNGTRLDFAVSAKVFDFDDARLSIVFNYIDSQHFTRLEMPINKIPLGEGNYNISPYEYMGVDSIPQGILFTMENDLALDDYIILEGAINTLTINNLYTGEQKVSGTFDLTFVIDTMFTIKKDGFPDTIYLRNGVFQTPYTH